MIKQTSIISPPTSVKESLIYTDTYARLTATEFINLLGRNEISIYEYVHSCCERIKKYDAVISAWEYFDQDMIEERAKKMDKEIAAGKKLLSMTGVMVGIKDIFNTYDMPTSMGSQILAGHTPGNDARVVSDIRLNGGIIAGKTVTAEFAVHHPGNTLNPHNLKHTPGTSSSGSAAAVATYMVPVALSSQTGGSTIRPASYCGVYGFKPSFGLLPRTAMLKTTDTLDSIGFISRSVSDLRMLFEAIRVRGHNYPVSDSVLNESKNRDLKNRPWKVGIVVGPKTSYEADVPRRKLDNLLKKLNEMETEIFEFKLPSEFQVAHHIHEKIYQRALAYYFKNEWSNQSNLLSDSLRFMIEKGLEISPEEYQKSIETQVELSKLFDNIVQKTDVLISLSTSDEAPVMDTPDLPDHCLIWTLCGAPSISLPVLEGSTGLPVGAQIVSRRFDDYSLLNFVEYLENSINK